MRMFKVSAVLLLVLLLVVSCGKEAGMQVTGKILIDGSSTVAPVTGAIIEEFQRENDQIELTMGISGTGGGFKKFVRGETVISNASRLMKPQEELAASENGVEFIAVSVAKDAISVVVSQKNDFVRDLTVEQLKKIWLKDSLVVNWSDIDPSWPAEKIKLFGPGKDSGTYDYFKEVILGGDAEIRTDYTASEDDNVLVMGVAGDKDALGFFGFSYYEENKQKLTALSINGVKPSEQTVNNGQYTPLSRPLFLYINKKAYQESAAVKLFVDFYLDVVGDVAKDIGYPPLTDKELEAQKVKLSE
ncbi:MAG: PstS family phosphate ABC transporter substrate-binding protein [Culicoidibacterales bacterium]